MHDILVVPSRYVYSDSGLPASLSSGGALCRFPCVRSLTLCFSPSEPVKEMEAEPEEGEASQSPEPPSSDEEDTVHVTIGKVKAHPHRPGRTRSGLI